MIRYLYADQLTDYPKLKQTMFRDRATQFSDRLAWDLFVNAQGFELDPYDGLNPLYVISETSDGAHAGSMRFLPTTGPVMVNDHFMHLTDGVAITSPLIWECTRFCISPKVKKQTGTSAMLMLAGAQLGKEFHLAHAVGVFDARMTRVYRALGWAPDILGTTDTGPDPISVGLWDFAAAPFDVLCQKAGVAGDMPATWFNMSFSQPAGLRCSA